MPKIPALRPDRVIRALEKAGFSFVRQKGSHRLYLKGHIGITVPCHSRDMRRGTLRHIIKQSGMTIEEFLDLL